MILGQLRPDQILEGDEDNHDEPPPRKKVRRLGKADAAANGARGPATAARDGRHSDMEADIRSNTAPPAKQAANAAGKLLIQVFAKLHGLPLTSAVLMLQAP